MPRSVPVRKLRGNLSEVLNEVTERREHVLVTRNGKPAAALVPFDEYVALEETADILSDGPTLAALAEGLDELERGDTVDFDEVRRELAQRRAQR